MMDFRYSLPTGTLSLSVHNGANPQDFFTIAARDNPKRAFLFLSTCLGKHLPTPPAKMVTVQKQLADQLPAFSTPTLFIGMAETATALGRGVYDLWRQKNPQQESLYLATTRYQVAGFKRVEFAEEHSHAPAIGLHIPEKQNLREIFFAAKTLVLIDDELSTGNTFLNLVKTLHQQGLAPEKVIMVALTDFSTAYEQNIQAALAPLVVEKVSLLTGSWSYQVEKSNHVADHWQTQTGKRVTLPSLPDFAARTGANLPLSFSPSILETWQNLLRGKKKILVLGCGEFMAAPFVLAQMAEKAGIETYFCATTRSPIKIWGKMTQRFEWQDPYQEGVKNFLYNYQRDQYDDVFLVSELPENEILCQTAAELHATLFCLSL